MGQLHSWLLIGKWLGLVCIRDDSRQIIAHRWAEQFRVLRWLEWFFSSLKQHSRFREPSDSKKRTRVSGVEETDPETSLYCLSKDQGEMCTHTRSVQFSMRSSPGKNASHVRALSRVQICGGRTHLHFHESLFSTPKILNAVSERP